MVRSRKRTSIGASKGLLLQFLFLFKTFIFDTYFLHSSTPSLVFLTLVATFSQLHIHHITLLYINLLYINDIYLFQMPRKEDHQF